MHRGAALTHSTVKSQHLNMAEYMMENVEDDHYLEDFFPKAIPHHLQPLIEYRIKLVMKGDSLFLPGETQVVNTSCLMKGKSRKKISMFLTQYENLPLSFESCGYIDRNYTGRVMIKLTNYSSKKIKLNSGCPIGYIVMQPYSME